MSSVILVLNEYKNMLEVLCIDDKGQLEATHVFSPQISALYLLTRMQGRRVVQYRSYVNNSVLLWVAIEWINMLYKRALLQFYHSLLMHIAH